MVVVLRAQELPLVFFVKWWVKVFLKKKPYKRFFMVDKQGLLFDDMDDLTPEQKPFAKKRADFSNADKLTDLLEVVKTVKPTILVGTQLNLIPSLKK